MPSKPRYRPERDSWEVIERHPGKKPKKHAIGRGEQGRLEAEAYAARLNEQEQLVESLSLRGSGDTFPLDQVLKEWHAAYKSTFSRGYEVLADGIIRNHLIPFFGARDLRTLRLEPDGLALVTAILAKEGIESTAPASHALSILRRVSTIHARHLPQGNQFLRFGRMLKKIEKRLSRAARTPDAWTLDELQRMFALAREREPWLYPMIVFASHTGTRQGEMLGVTWQSIDFSRGVVTVVGQLQDGQIEATKEGRQVKRVPMDAAGPLLRAVLEEIAEQRNVTEPWTDPGLVFTSPDGKPIDASNFRRVWRRFTRLLTAEKVRPLTWHEFRHTFVSHAVPAYGLARVGSWIGHSSVYMTSAYQHLVPEPTPARGFFETPAAPTKLRAVDVAS